MFLKSKNLDNCIGADYLANHSFRFFYFCRIFMNYNFQKKKKKYCKFTVLFLCGICNLWYTLIVAIITNVG